MTAQSSEPALEVGITTLTGRIRAAVGQERLGLELSQVYRRATHLPSVLDDPPIEHLVFEGHDLRQPDTRALKVQLRRPASEPRRAQPARRLIRRIQGLMGRRAWLWQEALLLAAVVGIAIPFAWTQVATLTLVALAVTGIASASVDE